MHDRKEEALLSYGMGYGTMVNPVNPGHRTRGSSSASPARTFPRETRACACMHACTHTPHTTHHTPHGWFRSKRKEKHEKKDEKKKKRFVETQGFDPRTSRMLSARSTN